jgi:RNase H-like domain found in reverse transcriptase
MCIAPVLAMLNFSKKFVLETDVLDTRVGAVLVKNKQPIARLSRTLGVKGHIMSIYENELLSLITVNKNKDVISKENPL